MYNVVYYYIISMIQLSISQMNYLLRGAIGSLKPSIMPRVIRKLFMTIQVGLN